jgi:hypothetical protein
MPSIANIPSPTANEPVTFTLFRFLTLLPANRISFDDRSGLLALCAVPSVALSIAIKNRLRRLKPTAKKLLLEYCIKYSTAGNVTALEEELLNIFTKQVKVKLEPTAISRIRRARREREIAQREVMAELEAVNGAPMSFDPLGLLEVE